MPFKSGWWDVPIALQNSAEAIKLNSMNRQESHPRFSIKKNTQNLFKI